MSIHAVKGPEWPSIYCPCHLPGVNYPGGRGLNYRLTPMLSVCGCERGQHPAWPHPVTHHTLRSLPLNKANWGSWEMATPGHAAASQPLCSTAWWQHLWTLRPTVVTPMFVSQLVFHEREIQFSKQLDTKVWRTQYCSVWWNDKKNIPAGELNMGNWRVVALQAEKSQVWLVLFLPDVVGVWDYLQMFTFFHNDISKK